MDLRQLRYFVRVAELGSFSKAATFLHIAQPALSRQIYNLEQEHQEALFVRTGRGVRATEAGERLLDHARGIIRLIERAEEDMENARTGKAGRIVIGMPGTLSEVVALDLIKDLRTALPDARVTLIHGRSSELQQLMMTGRLDMALVLEAPATPALEVHDVSSKRLVLVGVERFLKGMPDPVPLVQVARIPLVIPSPPNKVRMMLESEMARIGMKMKVVLESDSLETASEMVREGIGCTPRFYRHDPLGEQLLAREITDPRIELKSQIILPARRPISRLQDTALEVFLDVSCRLLRQT